VHLLIVGKLSVRVNAVPVDVIGVNGVAPDSVSQGDTALDKFVRSSILNVDPSLVGKLRPLSAEKTAICRCVPRAAIVAVASLHEAGIEVANNGDVARALVLSNI